jgi:type II secretory pathway component PulF
LFSIYFSLAIPKFADMFRGFGIDLPSITAFVIGKHFIVWPLLVLSFLAQLALYIYFLVAKTYSARRVMLLASSVNAAIQLVLLFAFYAPTFKLGSVV